MSRRRALSIRPLEKDSSNFDLETHNDLIIDESMENKVIGQMNYIRMFLAGKLVFPPDTQDYLFEFKDLEELGSLGHGSFGTVTKMRHIMTGMEMAVKVR
uniref:Protein kinase domain-containing protein n=1 Tax=Angiostrongylus cantonensis TaxID=6313 RepID=A0A0K0D6G9_ANGCA